MTISNRTTPYAHLNEENTMSNRIEKKHFWYYNSNSLDFWRFNMIILNDGSNNGTKSILFSDILKDPSTLYQMTHRIQ